MDTSDAIPSDGDPVVIPDHLRELLRATAEPMLEEPCDMAFAPDARDAAIAAVHLIDAFEHESLTRGVALAPIPGAIEWEEPVRMPHTLEGVAQYERQLALARELIELRDGLGGSPPPPSNAI
jgi:hypothetical protein